jgi:hypothetical protein
MATQYFFAHGDAQYGPYSAAQLLELANAGKIQPNDSVWRAGVGRPIPAWRVKHLFPDMQALPELESEAEPEASPGDDEADAKAASAFTHADEKPAVKPPEKERPRRVVTIKGGIIGGQDGKYVQFRKKCEKCGFTEQGKSTTLIRPGTMKITFFCRKCRKGRVCQMNAIYG